MNTPILNRNFQHPTDGWYHIEPSGEHPNTRSGVVQVIDQAACESIVNRFNAAAQEGKLSHGHEMLVDHEHFRHDEDKETRAYGWLSELQNRADGLYGKIRWTATGKPAVDGGDYRFFSTEYSPDDLQVVNRETNRVRPLALSGLTLTNDPNNKGGKPITNREPMSPESPASLPAGKSQKADTQKKDSMKKIAAKLGLSAEASEDAILDEIETLIGKAKKNNKTEEDEEKKELKNRLSTLLDEQIGSELETAGITDAEQITELKPYLTGLKNREARQRFLKTLKPASQETAAAQNKTPLTNRATAKTPGTAAVAGKDAQADQKKAIAIRNRAQALQKDNNKLTDMQAFLAAQKEIEQEG